MITATETKDTNLAKYANHTDISSDAAFIQANTIPATLEEIQEHHVIPVFIKDNEPVIAHTDFIETTIEVAQQVFPGEAVLSPGIRLSHPVKGRVPEARNKTASELLEHEKTIYYERMAFLIEMPGIQETIAGNTLSLAIGGVKAYNQDNLYSRKGADEHFKVFIGFQNHVCTNLCVSTDGFMGDLKVKSLNQLKDAIHNLICSYNMHRQLQALASLDKYTLTEQQFALLIGRCRLYQYLNTQQKAGIPTMQLSDTQLTAVAKDYYRDHSFCRDDAGNINLWRLYNLFTGANKSSYIDTFLDRSVNAFDFVHGLKDALDHRQDHWFLN